MVDGGWWMVVVVVVVVVSCLLGWLALVCVRCGRMEGWWGKCGVG
jgi:hypothetical protein